MIAFTRGPVHQIEIQEKDRNFCDTTCPYMDTDNIGDLYCRLYYTNLVEDNGDYQRDFDCVKNEIKTQIDEEVKP